MQREWLGEKSGIQTTSWGNAISEGPLFLFSHCCSRLPCLLGETRISDCRMESGSFPHITLPAQPQPRWESFEGRKGISCDHEPTTTGWFLGRVSKLKGEREDVHGKPGRLRRRPLSSSWSVEKAPSCWPLRVLLLGKVRGRMEATEKPCAQEMVV